MHRRFIGRALFSAIAVAALVSACSVEQPASSQLLAAIEVSLRTPADRADLLAMLHRHARAGGLHVDDVSEQWRRLDVSDHPPAARDVLTKTIYVGLWRGVEDDDMEVMVDDGGHRGRPWLMFRRGKHPELASRVRTGLLADIKRRWPDARDVPVMPNGALPLPNDLVWTGGSYAVKAERVAGYARSGD